MQGATGQLALLQERMMLGGSRRSCPASVILEHADTCNEPCDHPGALAVTRMLPVAEDSVRAVEKGPFLLLTQPEYWGNTMLQQVAPHAGGQHSAALLRLGTPEVASLG